MSILDKSNVGKVVLLFLLAPLWVPGLLIGIVVKAFVMGLKAGMDLFE